MSPFKRPGAVPEGIFQQKEHIDDGLLVRLRSYGEWPPIKSGEEPRPYGQCDLVILTDGFGPPADEPTMIDGRLSGSKLLPQLEMGAWVCGRLVYGEATGGRSKPYILADPDEKLAQVADEWLAAHGNA